MTPCCGRRFALEAAPAGKLTPVVRERCDAGVRKWFGEAASEELFVSVLVLGEIRQGIERIRLRYPTQARTLEKWLRWVWGSTACRWLLLCRLQARQLKARL